MKKTRKCFAAALPLLIIVVFLGGCGIKAPQMETSIIAAGDTFAYDVWTAVVQSFEVKGGQAVLTARLTNHVENCGGFYAAAQLLDENGDNMDTASFCCDFAQAISPGDGVDAVFTFPWSEHYAKIVIEPLAGVAEPEPTEPDDAKPSKEMIDTLKPLVGVPPDTNEYDAEYARAYPADMDGDGTDEIVTVSSYAAFGDEAPASVEVWVTFQSGERSTVRIANPIYDGQCHTYLFQTENGSLLAVTYYFPDGGGSYTLFVRLSEDSLLCAQHEGWITGYEDGVFYTESESFSLESLTFTPVQR